MRIKVTFCYAIFLYFSLCTLANADPIVLSGVGTSTLDGIIDSEEWADAATFDFYINTPEQTTTLASLYFMNDSTDMFFALEFARPSEDPGKSFNIEFDSDASGTISDGDDAIVANPSIGLVDDYRQQVGSEIFGPEDVSLGGTNDGDLFFTYNGTNFIYEFSHPFNSGDIYDVSLEVGDVIDLYLFNRLIATGADYPVGFGDTSVNYGIVAIEISPAAPVPEPATMLLIGTGLIGLAGFRKRFFKK